MWFDNFISLIKHPWARVILVPLLAILLLVGAIGGTALAIRLKPEMVGLSKGNMLIQAEVEALLADIGKLIALPADETPTVATVSDSEKLKNQPFFKNAQTGDKVIIYSNARKAILYRPTENKIVEVGAVNINQQNQPTPSATETITQPVTFAIYNGTATGGLSQTMADTVSQAIETAEILTRTNASKLDYQASVLVDLKNKPEIAKTVAEALKLSVGPLPAGERRPENVDFLIIVGRDRAE